MTSEEKLAQSVGVTISIQHVKIGKFNLNYIKAGEGQPLLLIHGGNIGWGQWYPNIADLSRRFTVYALDLPGGGRSSRLDFFDLDLQKDLVEITEAFIKYLNLDSLCVLGSSMGGWVAMQLALKGVNLKKLVLVDSLGFTDYMSLLDRILAIRPLAKILTKTVLKPVRSNKNIEKFLRSVFLKSDTHLDPNFVDYFYETMATSHNLLFISRLSSFWGVRKEFLLHEQLRNIKNSTLIIWGAGDKLMPLAQSEHNFKLIPNVKIEVISNAGHIPSVEQAEIFNKIVLNFLSGT